MIRDPQTHPLTHTHAHTQTDRTNYNTRAPQLARSVIRSKRNYTNMHNSCFVRRCSPVVTYFFPTRSSVCSLLQTDDRVGKKYVTTGLQRRTKHELCIITLRASEAAAQCIVIAPVYLFVCGCIDSHQPRFVGKGSDHLQLIIFWPSRAPGKGVCGGRKFLALPYYSQRSVFASPLSVFSFMLISWADTHNSPVSSLNCHRQ